MIGDRIMAAATKDKKKIENSIADSSEKEENNEVKPRCFVIMPISTPSGYADDHFNKVYRYIIKPAVDKAGFVPVRVDEDGICDSIINKILKNLTECEMAICDLSSRNPNVMYELGIRQAFGKKVVLIQDEKTDKIFDVSGINTIFYNSNRVYEDVVSSQDEISAAIKDTFENGDISLLSLAKIAPASTESKPLNNNDEMMIILRSIMSKISSLEKQNNREVDKKTIDNVRFIDFKFRSLNRMMNSENPDLDRINTKIINLRRYIMDYDISELDRKNFLNELEKYEIKYNIMQYNTM